jgi:hypothetical protein
MGIDRSWKLFFVSTAKPLTTNALTARNFSESGNRFHYRWKVQEYIQIYAKRERAMAATDPQRPVDSAPATIA